MRVMTCFLLCLLAGPALAETSLRLDSGSPAAVADLVALSAALSGALDPGGERADCPLRLDANGSVAATLTLVAGPPEGWSLTVGPADAPVLTATGAAGDAASAAKAILDHFCGPKGGAATRGPWTASGGGPEITITGTVDNLLAFFTLAGTFPGGTAVFEYAPVSMGGGAVVYTMSGSGATGSGEGLYTLTAMPGDVYVLEQTTDGCVDGVPNSCRTNTEIITLTPGG